MPPTKEKEQALENRFGFFLSTILEVAELSPELRMEYAKKLEAEGYTSLKLLMKLDENKLQQCGIRTAHCQAIAEAVQAFRDFGYATFVSHNKENAGSEAAMIGDFFRVKYGPDRRAFVDTDELKKLSDIVLAAEMSETAVVILSDKYCRSAFCLIEAIKCVEMKKKIATIIVIRPSLERFDFTAMSRGLDDDRFVKGLLPEKGWAILKEHMYDHSDVKRTLKSLMDIRAHEFSPHSPATVRTAQLSEVFKFLGFEPTSRSTSNAFRHTRTRMTVAQQQVFVSDLESAVKALGSPLDPKAVRAGCAFLYDATGGDEFDEDDKWRRSRVAAAGAEKELISTLKSLVKHATVPHTSQSKHDDKLDALLDVMKLARNMARDYEHGVEMFKLGLSDVVIDAMMKFNKTSVEVALWGCRILANLAVNDPIRTALSKLGATGACLDAAKVHFDSSDELCEAACNVFRAMAVTDEDKFALGSSGVPFVLVQICLLKGPANARIAEKACAAIRNMATTRDNQRLFASLNTDSALLVCLKAHLLDDVAVTDKACGAVENLSASEELLRGMKHANEFGPLVVQALERHGLVQNDSVSASAAEEALGAIQNLAMDDNIRHEMFLAEVNSAVIRALQANAAMDFRVAEKGAAAVRNLARGEPIAVDLCRRGVLGLLISCLVAHESIPSVVEQALAAIWGLSNCPLNDEAMISNKISQAVMRALRAHLSSLKVCRKGCGAIRNLTAIPKGAEILSRDGCNALLMEILRTHAMKDAQVAEEACGALKNMQAMAAQQQAHKVDIKAVAVAVLATSNKGKKALS